MRIALRTSILSLTVSLFLAGCVDSQPSPEQVRAAVLDAGVLGQSPTEVERRLREGALPGGAKLEVDSFNERQLDIRGAVRDSNGRPPEDWSVVVLVHFDSLRRAVSIEAYDSAVNPL